MISTTWVIHGQYVKKPVKYPINIMMKLSDTKNSYYIKDTRGKLILISEQVLLEMLDSKTLKPSSKIYHKIFQKWMKVSDLNLYKNKSALVNTQKLKHQQIKLTDNEQETQESEVQIINLLDKLEDAQEVINQTRFEGQEQNKKAMLKNIELESKLAQMSAKFNSVSLENAALNHHIRELNKEKIEYLKDSMNDNVDVQNTKLTAQVQKLKKKIKLIELDYKSEVEVSNHLLIQIEKIKKETMELYERNEYHETRYKKLEKDRNHYQENIQIYKHEIERLNHEKNIIQNQFDKLLDKYKNSKHNSNEQKEAIVEDHHQLELLTDQLKEKNQIQEQKIQKLNKMRAMHEKQITDLKEELAHQNKINKELRSIPPVPSAMDGAFVDIKHQSELKDKKIVELTKQIEELKASTVSKIIYEQTSKKLKYYENSYNLLFNKTKAIAQKWQDSQKQIHQLKAKKNINKKIKNAKNDDTKINQHLEQINKAISENPLHSEKTVGKLYKIENGKIWKINHPDYKDNTYNIFDLKELIAKQKIDRATKIKTLGFPWKQIKNSVEFNSLILCKDNDGVTEYFIERQNLRFPCHFLIKVYHKNSNQNGICVNISEKGCLLELQENSLGLKNQDKIKLELIVDSEQTYEIECIVKNHNHDLGTYTFGCEFLSKSQSFNQWLMGEIDHETSLIHLKEAA